MLAARGEITRDVEYGRKWFHELNCARCHVPEFKHRQFLTMALHGVGTTAPYGHDGRSSTLMDVIPRHGGEAKNENIPLRCQ